MIDEFIILQDTREQKGWGFEFYDCRVEPHTIKYGDYTIAGAEDRIRIERKASTGELLTNLCTKNGLRKFKKELAALKETVDSFYILCEFPEHYMHTFPVNSGIPKTRRGRDGKVVDNTPKVTAAYLRKCMYMMIEEYGVKVIYCDSPQRAEEVAYEILRKAYEKHK